MAVALDAHLYERRSDAFGPSDRPLLARVVQVPAGALDADSLRRSAEDWFGLLILDGVLALGIESARACTTWLVGEEDLIRPWEVPDVSAVDRVSWTALTDTRLALLDDDFMRRGRMSPALTRELVARMNRTGNWLLARSLVTHSPIVEERLTLLFGLLAERWGKVRPDGIRLDLPLTHGLLANMCGARRPSVSIALGSLRCRGVLERLGRRTWLLHADPHLGTHQAGPAPRQPRTAETRASSHAFTSGATGDVSEQGDRAA